MTRGGELGLLAEVEAALLRLWENPSELRAELVTTLAGDRVKVVLYQIPGAGRRHVRIDIYKEG